MKPKDKKAVELSMNTIIIAAIVVIVFIVIVFITTDKLGAFTSAMKECKDGDPMTESRCLSLNRVPTGDYYKDGQPVANNVCCKK